MMSAHQVVLWLDHRRASVLRFDGDRSENRILEAATHPTRRRRSEVRTGHEFFDRVCDELESSTIVLVTGSHGALDDFRHYVRKHRPRLDPPHIVGWMTVDHPSEPQLVALARRFFIGQERIAAG